MSCSVERHGEEALEGLWVIVPAYQEGAAIAQTVAGLRRFVTHIVVVDDGSTDGTPAVAAASGAVVLSHPINVGQGAALQTGFDFALKRGAAFICTFDADGQHDPATIPLLLERLTETSAQVALGSRFLGGTIGMSCFRRAVLKLAIAFTRIQTRMPLTDTHNGLRLFTRQAALKIRISQSGMAHGSELISSIVRLKLAVIEVPTIVRYTDYSKRKGQKLSNSVKIVCDLMYAALCRS